MKFRWSLIVTLFVLPLIFALGGCDENRGRTAGNGEGVVVETRPCSVAVPTGVCPQGPQWLCVDGICRSRAELEPCSVSHPQGHCILVGQVCVEGVCTDEEANRCSPDNPTGTCAYGSMCVAGVCYPVSEDELCSPAEPQGLCPSGKVCSSRGECVVIGEEELCSPSNPEGLCDSWQSCVDGECTESVPPDACSSDNPDGRCPTGSICTIGVCEPISEEDVCSAENPDGICPQQTYCTDAGVCAPLTGPQAPCSPQNPQGTCPFAPDCVGDCEQLCIDGVCKPAAQIDQCSSLHSDGWCSNGLLCDAGVCEVPDPSEICSSLNPEGQCPYGSICAADGVCYPVTDAELCSAQNPAGLCPPNEFCNGGFCEDVADGEQCSPTNPYGHCPSWAECIAGECSQSIPPDLCSPSIPSGRCPSGEICTDGVCDEIAASEACSQVNSDGLCPDHSQCVDGFCVPSTGFDSPCSPDNPEGYCPEDMACTSYDGCIQITPDNACSEYNPSGVCPAGMYCHGLFGECRVSDISYTCSPTNPEGLCDGQLSDCVDGVCVEQICSEQHPDGNCPNGLFCANGECLFPPCGPAVPYSGICPPGYVCADARCQSLTQTGCSAESPQAPCQDSGKRCDDQEGSPTFGTCVWACSQLHTDGMCAAGDECHDGWCFPPCASGIICPYSGACCDIGEECGNSQTCVPACPTPRQRCASDQICCPEGWHCAGGTTCAPPCDSEVVCGVWGEVCCHVGEICTAEMECAPSCAPEEQHCADTCCAANETCLHDECVASTGSCSDFLDCEYNEYCEPIVGVCLPAQQATGEVCQYDPPTSIFEPTTQWRWTGVWPDCAGSLACHAGSCATLCESNDACIGECVEHRCACASDDDCDASNERCGDGVCVARTGGCGDRYENVMSMATVADIDHDGHPEVVFRAYAGDLLGEAILVVLDGRDGGDGSGKGSPAKMVLSPDLADVMPWLSGSGHQALANLDDDVELEIVAVAAQGLVAINDPADFDTADGDGVVLWHTTQTPLDRHLNGGAPAIVDINGDGKVEIVMGAAVLDGETGAILAAPTGAAATEGGGSRFDGGWISIAADLDLDGRPEIITGNRAWKVEESAGLWSMSLLWESTTDVSRPPNYDTTVDIPHGFSAVANFVVTEGADYPEVVNVSGGNLYFLDGLTGVLLAGPIPVPAGASGTNHGGAPTVADFDGDGRPEVAAAGSGCYSVYDLDCLAGYDADTRADLENLPGCDTAPEDRCGSYPSMVGVLWNYAAQDFSSACTGSSVFDFDGDGIDEVLYNDECFFRVFDGRSGDVLLERPNSSRTNSEYPIVVDVDGDRNSEIVLVANHDQVSRDHCAANHDDNPDYASYRHYDDIAGLGDYCDLTTFPEHTRECTVGAAGITVFGDASERWVKTRPIWHQHAYHVTDVDLDKQTHIATTPTQERPSWTGSNTYRKNTKGFVPLNAPDVRITHVTPSLHACPEITVNARVANLGSLGTEAFVPVSFFGMWQDPPVYLGTVYTMAPLLPGAGEYVTFQFTAPEGVVSSLFDLRVVADITADGGGDLVHECREDNNSFDVFDLLCVAPAPVARCLVEWPLADDIEPLDSVTFNGSFSYDPRDPAAELALYAWEVIDWPEGAWPGDFAQAGNGTDTYSMWLPIAGTYTVALTVTGDDGVSSDATQSSLCVIEAVPRSAIHVQLVWDHSAVDMDLHGVWWTNPSGNRELFEGNDCYYANPIPDWFSDFPQNPRLDIDDTYGYGPENLNVDQPAAGTYRLYVNYAGNHYDYGDMPPITSTIRIYLDGVLAGEFVRTIRYHADIWAVADVVWRSATDFSLVPLPSDNPIDPNNVGYICQVFYDWNQEWWDTTCPTE